MPQQNSSSPGDRDERIRQAEAVEDREVEKMLMSEEWWSPKKTPAQVALYERYIQRRVRDDQEGGG